MKKRRTVTYIDGFNLYYAIKDLDRPNLKWVDLWKLSETFLRKNETLEGVYYFTAYATWMPDRMLRHRRYTKALVAQGVNIVFGKFKDKFLTCRKCGRTYETKEEKETDVNIATALITDAFQDKYDRAILITADTDLRPPIDTVRKNFPNKEILVAAPPGRLRRARGLQPKYDIKPGRLANCLLPKEIKDAAGDVIAKIPSEWDKLTTAFTR